MLWALRALCWCWPQANSSSHAVLNRLKNPLLEYEMANFGSMNYHDFPFTTEENHA
jgi:hypothetical protein